MNLEIERRFLVDESLIKTAPIAVRKIEQGYFQTPNGTPSVRVRFYYNGNGPTEFNSFGFITIKKKLAQGTYEEYEYEIPASDAKSMLDSLEHKLTKTRSVYPANDGLVFEVDKFDQFDVCIAEVEVSSMDDYVEIPDFCVKEITNVEGLSNYNMAMQPFKAQCKIDAIKA